MQEERQKPEMIAVNVAITSAGTAVIGARQTVDIVELAPWGRGRLVWKNGPAFFLADSGEIVELEKVGAGGARSNPAMSWRGVWEHKDGGMKEAVVIEPGEDHSRWFSPLFGDGWLVFAADYKNVRFESHEGEVKLRFELLELCVGRPEYRMKMMRSATRMPKIDDPDEMNWSTYRTKDGTLLTFRRGGPHPGHFLPVKSSTYILFTTKAKKAYDAAKKVYDETIAAAPAKAGD